jgi:hypothetical protein
MTTTTKSRRGRPTGCRSKAPEEGSLTELIVRAYDTGLYRTRGELREACGCSRKLIDYALDRWREGWRAEAILGAPDPATADAQIQEALNGRR